ncbi:hypothetical protein POY65_21070, partial [Phocaeicola vulgatus]|nr:hypothetical protein [Phocaeicola vulgatus]
LLPKDTKSLGNNKAPACESRGFVRKKQKVCILTHLRCIHKYNIVVKDGNVIITGGSISGWTPGNEEEDIVINGEEINPQTNNML